MKVWLRRIAALPEEQLSHPANYNVMIVPVMLRCLSMACEAGAGLGSTLEYNLNGT